MNPTQMFPAGSDPEVFSLLAEKEEKAYRDNIRRCAEKAMGDGVRFVFLAGPSCSGKTTTSRLMSDVFRKAGKRVASLSTDDFFFDGERAPLNEDGTPNYDAFEHIDSAYLVQVIRRFETGETVRLPFFDFKKGKRKTETLRLFPADFDVLFVEGIHALNDVILSAPQKQENSARLYLDVTRPLAVNGADTLPLTPSERRFCRRLIRDYKHRSASADLTFSLWDNAVRSESAILHPFLQNATDILTTNFAYEIGVEKDEILSLLNDVEKESLFYGAACALKEKLAAFRALPETLVPSDSVLREFID